MDKKEAIIKIKKYANLIKDKINPNKIILFGSYAKGNFNKDSDIDIAIIVDKIEEDFLDMEFYLYNKRREIDDRIEPILIENNDNKSGFLDEILKTGIIVNY